jgi:hypothetical protein
MASIGEYKTLEQALRDFMNERIDAMGYGTDPTAVSSGPLPGANSTSGGSTGNTTNGTGPYPDPFNPYAGPTKVQGYYGGYMGNPTPAPEASTEPKLEDVKTKLELKKYYEFQIEKTLGEMTPASKAMLYKHLYILGMRIGDCEPAINAGLEKEFKALKKS